MVDHKDLDYQTMWEYDRFEKGTADSNTSTAILRMRDLLSSVDEFKGTKLIMEWNLQNYRG